MYKLLVSNIYKNVVDIIVDYLLPTQLEFKNNFAYALRSICFVGIHNELKSNVTKII